MALLLSLTPEKESRLKVLAHLAGISPEEFIQRLIERDGAMSRSCPKPTATDAPADRRGRRFVQGVKEPKDRLSVFLTEDPKTVKKMTAFYDEYPISQGVFLQKVLDGYFTDASLFDPETGKAREETIGEVASLDLAYSIEHGKRMPYRKTSVMLPASLTLRMKSLQEESGASQAMVLYAALQHFFRTKKRRG